MATYILLSSIDWDRGFNNATAHFIEDSLVDTRSLLYIASDPGYYEKTDYDAGALIHCFERRGTFFETHVILDRRMPENEQLGAVERASVIFLGGGDALKQIDYLKTRGLTVPLRDHTYIIGLSAGTINMARRSVLPVNPSRERTFVYKGMSLVDMTVVPHFTRYDEAFIKTELLPLTYGSAIYGMCEDGAVISQNGTKRHAGTLYKMENGHIRLLGSEEML
jgi:peptidase E